ncbi:MAG: 5-formyltetrahydrofolate cyclo-ligase [Nocardioidaceae bacterium]
MSPVDPVAVAREKAALRDDLLARRGRLALADLVNNAAALGARAMVVPEVARAATVAAYVSVGREPGTGSLLDALVERGQRVLLPVLRRDGDLDWSRYTDSASLAPAARGLLEPVGSRLGVEAIGQANVVLCPGLAVDRRGRRLGRGGGSYDKALARVVRPTWVAVLLYDDEVVDHVPVDLHDRRVDAAITPSRLLRFSAAHRSQRNRFG